MGQWSRVNIFKEFRLPYIHERWKKRDKEGNIFASETRGRFVGQEIFNIPLPSGARGPFRFFDAPPAGNTNSSTY